MKFRFSKFIDDILKKEHADNPREINTRHSHNEKENPNRKLRQLYSEKWQNRIVWKKRGS